MAKYRATINLPGVRAGKTIEADPSDPTVAGRVAAGHLIPLEAGTPAPAAPTPPVEVPEVPEEPAETPEPNDDSGDADAPAENADAEGDGERRGRRR